MEENRGNLLVKDYAEVIFVAVEKLFATTDFEDPVLVADKEPKIHLDQAVEDFVRWDNQDDVVKVIDLFRQS